MRSTMKHVRYEIIILLFSLAAGCTVYPARIEKGSSHSEEVRLAQEMGLAPYTPLATLIDEKREAVLNETNKGPSLEELKGLGLRHTVETFEKALDVLLSCEGDNLWERDCMDASRVHSAAYSILGDMENRLAPAFVCQLSCANGFVDEDSDSAAGAAELKYAGYETNHFVVLVEASDVSQVPSKNVVRIWLIDRSAIRCGMQTIRVGHYVDGFRVIRSKDYVKQGDLLVMDMIKVLDGTSAGTLALEIKTDATTNACPYPVRLELVPSGPSGSSIKE